MGKRKRRYFSPEYKAEVVRLVQEGKPLGKTVNSIAKELDLTVTAVRDWVSRAESVAMRPTETAATAREQELLKEIRVLKMERDILKKAAAFFAKENT